MKKYSHFCIIFIALSCSNTKNNTSLTNAAVQNNLQINAQIDKQGHRGCRGLMPENTIVAMLTAIDLGVTTLEMDICFSKDKKAILSHEPFFNHEITTKPDGNYIEEKEEKKYNLFTMNYDSIIKYDVGLKPHPRFVNQQKVKATKPLLDDIFKTIKQEMKFRKRPFPYFNIETKTQPETDNIYHPAPAEFIDLLMKIIQDNDMDDYVIIQSFDYRTLKYLHQKFPTIKTALLIDEGQTIPKPLSKDIGFMPTILSPHYSFVTKNLVENLHAQNVKIIPWTVNDTSTIRLMKSLNVDGIISDYPNLLN